MPTSSMVTRFSSAKRSSVINQTYNTWGIVGHSQRKRMSPSRWRPKGLRCTRKFFSPLHSGEGWSGTILRDEFAHDLTIVWTRIRLKGFLYCAACLGWNWTMKWEYMAMNSVADNNSPLRNSVFSMNRELVSGRTQYSRYLYDLKSMDGTVPTVRTRKRYW